MESEIQKEETLITPNPSNGMLYFEGFKSDFKVLIDVISIDGKIVYQGELMSNSENAQINLQHLPLGNYWVRIKDFSHCYTQMIEIVH